MSCDLTALANAGIRGLQPYQPGKPISELQRELGLTDIVKLASNENPLGCSLKVREAMESCMADIARYPDANGYYLKQALSEKLGIRAGQITLGNGSNDVLDLIARTFAGPGREVIFSQHAFLVYPIVTKAVEAKAVVVPARNYGHDLDAMADAITEQTSLIFIANPNNPTGTWVSANELRTFLKRVPENVIVVVDEAYYEYVDSPDYPQTLSKLAEFPNLIVTRTFSKAYGLAGLRVGYSVSHPDVADLLNRIRQPFNVNSLALAAAEAALSDVDFLQKAVELNKAGMAYLTAAMDDMGYRYIPSAGNFLTIDFECDAQSLYQKLLHEGVIVRPVANYELPSHLRVSIGTMEENERFVQALKKVTGR
ncbi:MAG: histidinol-phosphate transaminase [Gammaproteobacteria bacterium]|nr:MAG: histidinol-phosphate transaminase [Gammaproteobacteria bacterium]